MIRLTAILVIICSVRALLASSGRVGSSDAREFQSKSLEKELSPLQRYSQNAHRLSKSRDSPVINEIKLYSSSYSRADVNLNDREVGCSRRLFGDLKSYGTILANKDVNAGNIIFNFIAPGLAFSIVGFMTAFVIIVLKHSIAVMDARCTRNFPALAPLFASIVLSGLFFIEPNMHKPALQQRSDISSSPTTHSAYLFFVSTKQLILRLVGLVVSIGSGCSLGLAGPAADIGMTVACIVNTRFFSGSLEASDLRDLLVAGAGAGIAANFNAPVTAALYAMEVVRGQLHSTVKGKSDEKDDQTNSTLRLLCSILSAVLLVRRGDLFASKAVLPMPTSLPTVWSPRALVVFPSLGLLVAAAFELYTSIKTITLSATRHLPSSLRVLIGGLANSIAAANLQPQSLSRGFPVVTALCLAKMSVMDQAKFLAAKMLAAPISAATGLVGGQFAPLFFIGAGVGSVFHSLLLPIIAGPHPTVTFTWIIPCVLAGGSAMLASNFKAILMSSMLIIELTKSVDVIVAVLLTSLTALGTTKMLSARRTQQ